MAGQAVRVETSRQYVQKRQQVIYSIVRQLSSLFKLQLNIPVRSQEAFLDLLEYRPIQVFYGKYTTYSAAGNRHSFICESVNGEG